MPAPPEDVSSNELFQTLLSRPRPSVITPFPPFDKPGKPGQIRIQVLAKNDHDRARFMARKRLKANASQFGVTLDSKDELSDAIRGVESDLAACEVLAMACLSVTPIPGHSEDDASVKYARVFADGEQVGKTLTADEVALLFSAYNIAQHKFGPHEDICSPEDVNMWVRRLVEGAEQNFFLRLSSPQWAELLTGLAQKLHGLSDLLTSQWESLPESWQSALKTYCLDTGSAGEPVVSSYESPLANEAEVSFEQAMRLTNEKLRRAPIEE